MSIYQCHHCSSNNRNLPSDQVISGSGSCYQAGWGRFCFQSFLSIQSPPRMFVGFGCWCYPCFVLFVCKFKHFFLGVGCDATRIRVGLNNNTSLDPFNLVESILSHGTYLESPHHSCHSFLSNMNSTFNVIYTYIYKYIMSMYADRWIHGVQICIIYIYICTSYILRLWRVQCFNPFNTHDGQDLPQKKQSAFFSCRFSFGGEVWVWPSMIPWNSLTWPFFVNGAQGFGMYLPIFVGL